MVRVLRVQVRQAEDEEERTFSVGGTLWPCSDGLGGG